MLLVSKGVTTLGGNDSHLCVVIVLGQLTHQSWHKGVSSLPSVWLCPNLSELVNCEVLTSQLVNCQAMSLLSSCYRAQVWHSRGSLNTPDEHCGSDALVRVGCQVRWGSFSWPSPFWPLDDFFWFFLLNLGSTDPNYSRRSLMRSSKAPPNQKNRGQVLPHPSEPSLRTWQVQRSLGVFRHFLAFPLPTFWSPAFAIRLSFPAAIFHWHQPPHSPVLLKLPCLVLDDSLLNSHNNSPYCRLFGHLPSPVPSCLVKNQSFLVACGSPSQSHANLAAPNSTFLWLSPSALSKAIP